MVLNTWFFWWKSIRFSSLISERFSSLKSQGFLSSICQIEITISIDFAILLILSFFVLKTLSRHFHEFVLVDHRHFSIDFAIFLKLWFCIENQGNIFHWKSIDLVSIIFLKYKMFYWIYSRYILNLRFCFANQYKFFYYSKSIDFCQHHFSTEI